MSFKINNRTIIFNLDKIAQTKICLHNLKLILKNKTKKLLKKR
jgi:hypothetical protein